MKAHHPVVGQVGGADQVHDLVGVDVQVQRVQHEVGHIPLLDGADRHDQRRAVRELLRRVVDRAAPHAVLHHAQHRARLARRARRVVLQQRRAVQGELRERAPAAPRPLHIAAGRGGQPAAAGRQRGARVDGGRRAARALQAERARADVGGGRHRTARVVLQRLGRHGHKVELEGPDLGEGLVVVRPRAGLQRGRAQVRRVRRPQRLAAVLRQLEARVPLVPRQVLQRAGALSRARQEAGVSTCRRPPLSTCMTNMRGQDGARAATAAQAPGK